MTRSDEIAPACINVTSLPIGPIQILLGPIILVVRAASVALFYLISVAPTTAQLYIDPFLRRVLTGAGAASLNLVKARDRADSILSDRPVREPDLVYNWDTLARQYRNLARDFSREDLVGTFEASAYTVSVEEYQNCRTQDHAVEKMRQYILALEFAVRDARSQAEAVENEMPRIQSAQEALNHLLKIHERLIQIPLYQQMFIGDWFSLETSVRPSLNDLEASAKNYISRIGNEADRMDRSLTNLRANLSLLGTNECLLVGTWHGRCVRGSRSSEVMLTLTGSNAGTLSGRRIFNVSLVNRRALNFDADSGESGVYHFSGQFNQNYSSLTGVLSRGDRTSQCSLTG